MRGPRSAGAETADEKSPEETEQEEGVVAGEEVEMQSENGSANGAAHAESHDSHDERDLEEQVAEEEAADAGEHVALQAEVQENHDKYLRAIAELENYKKRVAKERADILRYAGENLARDLLEVLDNLERALAQKPEDAPAEWVQGVQMVHDQFVAVLNSHSIKGESACGQPFDPNRHTAMTTVPVADAEPGSVIEELKKAYYFKDKLLRTAQVVVASAPPEEAPVEEDGESEAGESAEEG